ncbi:hypothetical protein PTE30175_03574 [Pandoraea terrae]|uniref:Lipoprotein n=1 Tax=Pandoraea terrae TaxID=1537710 RepID=A0A5E4X578_9BURK|nr:hypothetical protein [Pandoraea terrae]VVE31378.1 hypothetical protein PTE30175_03574 [Pandoraea terrae]
MKRAALLSAALILAGLAGCGQVQPFTKPDPASGRILDQGTEADRFMVLNCVYHGWSELSPDVDTTGVEKFGVERVRVHRGNDAAGKPIYDPVVDISQAGFGARIVYTEATPGKLSPDYLNTVKRCMVPYSGHVD